MEDNTHTENDDRGFENGLKWKEMFENTDVDERGIIFLRSSLVEQLYHGAISSIEIVNEPLGISILEEPFQNLILSPIEWFLFGEEPTEARKKLLEFNNPPTICAKIFKNGEPTYNCRDCALDGTCVLCMQCFGKSIHKDHNYRVSTSSGGGGGCCDCGDVEAWKEGASCELHTANPENSVLEDPLKKLPQEFVDRAKYVFSIVLDYCVNVICQRDNEELLPELKFNFASNDSYATVLFNDESHTFNDVISCLNKSFSDCTTKMAMEFATIVDREGRAFVFVGNFESCSTLCQSIQENSDRISRAGPLRCETLHLHLIACQLVALRLIKWVNDLTEQSDCFRRLHCLLCTTEFAGKNNLMEVLLADAKLWKAARFQMHELLMNMLLKDSLGKVSFGIEFVKNYSVIMNDFCADDQEHSISVTAMSVQIFTVPSLVQMLIVNYDVLQVVMKVLLQTSERFLGDNGVFDFKEDTFDKSRRLYHIINDLGYVLQNIGSEWNEVLKEKYLRFLELFLSFHRRFQGMRSTKRVKGNHVEFEPEWRKGITVQFYMADVLQLIAKWSKSDRDVLLRSVSITLKCLKDIRTFTGETKLKKHEGEKSVKTLDFDESSDYISIHIPIVRVLAGLIEACEIYSINIPDLLEIKEVDDILMHLEYPLKVLVMVAQVNAGMWKRNGDSILRQVHLYRKDLSTEMYDKDIFLMQALASCMDKDHFLIVLLDMFKLLHWSSSNFHVGKMDAASLNQQLSLAAEFLHLLIIILGERYKCSVGAVDTDYHLRRHVIHQLCLGAMSRSQLMNKLTLAKYKYKGGSGVDDVILSVTTFTKPGLSTKGMYKLKKEYFGEFNPFFYLYSKKEQSMAQEHQLARCKEEGISAAFVPPVPVQFSPLFANIVDLLSCRQLVDMLTVILWRITHNNPKSWTVRIFHEVLHLIGLALHEETRQRENQQSFGFLTAARKQLSNECKYSLIECLEALQGNPIIDDHVSLLRWTIKKFNDECFARDNPGVQPLADAPAVEMANEAQHEEEKMLKQRLAKQRREKLLLQMSNMQKAFIRENSELYSFINLDDTASDQADAPVASVPDHSTTPVIAIGNNRSPSVFVSGEQHICILCQEKPTSRFGGRPLVFSAYVQRSTNLSRAWGQTVEHGNIVDPLVAHRDQRVGVHTSSCGHAMHCECWQRFFESQCRNKRLHSALMLQAALDMANGEFLCPLCDGLSNTVVPLLLHVVPPEEERTDDNMSWVKSLHKIQRNINNGYFMSQPVDNSLISFFKEKFLTLLKTVVSVDMKSAISVFSQAAFQSGLNVEPNEEDPRVALMVWSTCAYTIQCFEHCARGENKPLAESLPKREMDALSSLILVSNSVVSVSKPSDVLNHCHRLISVLLGSEIRTNDHRSLMDIDLFDWMVKMRFSLPSLNCQNNSAQHGIPVESLSSPEVDVFVFHLALIATITQILLTTPEDIPTDEMDEFDEADEKISKQLSNLWSKMKDMCSQQDASSPHPHPQRLLRHVRCRLLPFLRCCAIFFHILNSTRVPVALKENFMSFDKEYEALSEFLALPKNLTEIFQWNNKMGMFNNDLVTKIFARWCSNCNLNVFTETFPSISLEPRHLIKLPHNFSELISYYSNFDCPMVSRDYSLVPAVCLVCGKLLCSDTFCCKETINGKSVGCCTAHALRCGAGIGIFLRISDCVVLLINGINRGCYYEAPYLDAYGETDQDLKIGNPLYLCHERYERLEKLWKRHRIASEIARGFGKPETFMGFDWANF